MIRRLILAKLAAEERRLGASMDYARFILRTSLGAFLKFLKIVPVSQYRRVLPVAPHHVARLVATRDEDCGTCVQIEVNLARQAGVDPRHLRAVLERRPEDLPDDLADTYRFAEAVVTSGHDLDEQRERMRRRFGDRGLVEMALAMAGCRVFPITKRALGFARSCSQVVVEV